MKKDRRKEEERRLKELEKKRKQEEAEKKRKQEESEKSKKGKGKKGGAKGKEKEGVEVKNKNGESPIKANGKLIVIDGGFSKAYRSHTGIAGYTLIYNSYGLQLVAHEPFDSTEEAIVKEKDILYTTLLVEKKLERKRVEDTDIGVELKKQIKDLKMLLTAYRKGLIK